jgi:hypothetical protein
MPNPVKDNSYIQFIMKHALAADAPPKPKVPVTNRVLAELRSRLDLDTVPAFTLWAGIRFAIALCCRISEWAIDGKHLLRWESLTFKDSEGATMQLVHSWQIQLVAELEIVFWSDKTHRRGDAEVRSFFAIPDLDDDRCIVRDMAKLWLVSCQVKEYPVFSWSGGTEGVTRDQVNSILTEAAIAQGVPGADVSSHSLRVTGLSRLLGADMPWQIAKMWGRWKSDCALRYFWPTVAMAQKFSASIWDSHAFARVRSGGELQHL